MRTKFSIATDLRDSIDAFQSNNDYESLLAKVLPEIIKLLETVPVSFSSTSPEHVCIDIGIISDLANCSGFEVVC